jgi:hypothetical protein
VLGDLLRQRVDPSSQAVALARDVSQASVERGRPFQRVEHLRLVPASERGANAHVVRADQADVDHAARLDRR